MNKILLVYINMYFLSLYYYWFLFFQLIVIFYFYRVFQFRPKSSSFHSLFPVLLAYSTDRVSQVLIRKMYQMDDTMMYLDNKTLNILYKDFFVFCHLLAFIYEKFKTSSIKTTLGESTKLAKNITKKILAILYYLP